MINNGKHVSLGTFFAYQGDELSAKKKILVVDDDPNISIYTTTLLEDNGYAATSAESVKAGMESIKANRPDLIVLDITMPEQSGVRLYRDVRSDPDLKTIPIVIVTGWLKEFERFIKTRRTFPPPDGYFSKPIDQSEFIKKIGEILGSDKA